MNHSASQSTLGRRGQDCSEEKEEGCLSPFTHPHSDSQAVSRVGDTQIWVHIWQNKAEMGQFSSVARVGKAEAIAHGMGDGT